MLDRFPTILVASTFLVLSLAVSHEWGYFSIVGVHFRGKMTAYDYFASADLSPFFHPPMSRVLG